MPMMQCMVDGKDGWKWGPQGKCYPGDSGKRQAIQQGLAEGGGHLKYSEVEDFSSYEDFFEIYRDVSTDQRKMLAGKGHAMPDGSFPIQTVADLKNAIHAYGRAGNKPAVMAFIKKRAKELGAEDQLPPNWKGFDVGSHSLDNVEIFAAGTHNNDKFTEADLDQIVSAFNELDFKPPLKQGHAKDQPGMPALGYVQSLKRVGSKLVATFSDIPTVVMDALKRKSYNAVSAEIYFNLTRAGKKFNKALKAVALLGADIPAVAGLAPLSSLFSEIDSEVRVYKFAAHEDDVMDEATKQTIADLQAKVKKFEDDDTAAKLQREQDKKKLEDQDKQIKQLQQNERDAKIKAAVDACQLPSVRPFLTGIYTMAYDAPETVEFALDDKTKVKPIAMADKLVEHLNTKLIKLFDEQGRSVLDRKEGDELDDPGAEFDRLAKKYAADKKVEYAEAFQIVLNDPENAELKQRYGAVQN